MTTPLEHSMLHFAIFPSMNDDAGDQDSDLVLRKHINFKPEPDVEIGSLPVVIFDFETTGLDPYSDRIIEVGAYKIQDGKKIDEFTSLLSTDVVITEMITSITGITSEMVEGKPTFDEILPKFIDFIRGSILVAHNAEFDWGMLKASCHRVGLEMDWPVYCTLKMSRKVLPALGRYNLDVLAMHYKQEFDEGRHRAVGDVKVLATIWHSLLEDDSSEPESLSDLGEYRVS